MTNDQNAAQRIGNTATRGEECDAHDTVGDPESEANDGDHPDHQVGEEAQPNDGHGEGHGIPLRPAEEEEERIKCRLRESVSLTVDCDSQES